MISLSLTSSQTYRKNQCRTWKSCHMISKHQRIRWSSQTQKRIKSWWFHWCMKVRPSWLSTADSAVMKSKSFTTLLRRNSHVTLLSSMNHHKNRFFSASLVLSSHIALQWSRPSMEISLITRSSRPVARQTMSTSLPKWASVIRVMSTMAAIFLIWTATLGSKETLTCLKAHTVSKQLPKPNSIMNPSKSIPNKWFTWPRTIPNVWQSTQCLML